MNTFRHAFPAQEADEVIFIFARPYWVAFLPTALIFFFLIILSLIAQFSIHNNVFLVPLTSANSQVLILVLGIFQLLALAVFMVAVLDFYFDIVLVTDRRVVDIDQEQLLFRRISQLELSDIEDVTCIVQGFFPSVFNYGSVEIQTAGEARNFLIANILHPQEVTSIVSDLSAQAKNDIPENKRMPHGNNLAVIGKNLVHNSAQLAELGVIDTGEIEGR